MDLPHTPFTIEQLYQRVEQACVNLWDAFQESQFPAIALKLDWCILQDEVDVKITWWRNTLSGEDYVLRRIRMCVRDDLGLIAFEKAISLELNWMDNFSVV